MTDQEILEKAIAQANFSIEDAFAITQPSSASDDVVYTHCAYDFFTNQLGYSIRKGETFSFISYQTIIFSHSFAKKFFGERGYPAYKTLAHEFETAGYDENKILIERCKICGILRKEDKFAYENCSEVIGISFSNETPCLCGRYNMATAHKVFNQGWEVHLKQMVLEKEPLKYLERFLK